MRTLITAATLAAIAPLAAATDVFIYPPAPTGGILVSSWVAPDGTDCDTYAYNDFTLATTEAITEVRWRGGYANGAPFGKAYQFTITFFATNITGSEPLVQTLPDPYGEPCLANYQVTGNAHETYAGTLGGTALYDYRHVLPAPFVATAGVKYWVRIVAWQPGYPDWGPTRGTGGNGSHFHYSTGSHMFQQWPGDTSFTLAVAWKDLGFAKTGSAGFPSLTATGGLASNASGSLLVANARPNATALGIVGAHAMMLPFLGGTLVPAPDLVFTVATSGNGQIPLPFVVPADVPPGADVYVQFWIADPAAKSGCAASNALRGTTQ